MRSTAGHWVLRSGAGQLLDGSIAATATKNGPKGDTERRNAPADSSVTSDIYYCNRRKIWQR